LSLARFNKCFADAADSSTLTTKVFAEVPATWRGNGPQDVAPVLLRLRSALELIAADATTSGDAAPAEWRPQFGFVVRSANADIQAIDEGRPTSGTANWTWNGANPHAAFMLGPAVFGIDYAPLVTSKCVTASAACQMALNSAVNLNRQVALMLHISKISNEPLVVSAQVAVGELRKRWDYYLNEARSQYLWELALNSKLYAASEHRLNAPPNHQWILLHPSAAFEYTGGGAQNERAYDAIIMLEAFGYNRFDWSTPEGKQSSLPPLGASLVVTYTPDNTGDHEGYGIVLHVANKYSFGITRRDTGAGKENTYLLSADFMKKVINTDPEEALKKFVKSKLGAAGAAPVQ